MARKKPAKQSKSKPSKPSKASKSKAPSKRAKPRRAHNKASDMSRAEVSILAKMAELDRDSPRFRVLEAALAFMSSWIILGEHLAEVVRTGLWRGWGYASFERYCGDEIHVTSSTAKKLVRGFQWLGAEAPELLAYKTESQVREPTKRAKSVPSGSMPDLGAINVLADAKMHYDEARVPEDAYLALKQAALEGETASALRRTLKEAIPLHLRPKSANDKVRHLRRALTASVKVIDALREWDSMPASDDGNAEEDGDELIVEAERLRDAIALRLPRTDAGGPVSDQAA
jgi:hypothetical protein